MKYEISFPKFIFFSHFNRRIGIVFTGNSEETMAVKILGKLEQ